MGEIKVIGLGPGRPGLITREAWNLMENAEHLVLRTAIHPTVEAIRTAGFAFGTYDEFYESAPDFGALYEAIARDLIHRAAGGENIVYAVPGSPLVAEHTVVLLRELAADRDDVELTIYPGMSFAEVLLTRLGLDPIEGVTLLDASDLPKLTAAPFSHLIVTQIYDSFIASDAKLALMELFSDDYPVTLTHALGTAEEVVREIPLYELDRQKEIDHLTSLFVPARREK